MFDIAKLTVNKKTDFECIEETAQESKTAKYWLMQVQIINLRSDSFYIDIARAASPIPFFFIIQVMFDPQTN